MVRAPPAILSLENPTRVHVLSLVLGGTDCDSDGTIAHDLPTKRLAELFNINQFMVSQTNPWVVPFLPSSDVKVADMPWSLRGIWKRIWHLAGLNIRYATARLSPCV